MNEAKTFDKVNVIYDVRRALSRNNDKILYSNDLSVLLHNVYNNFIDKLSVMEYNLSPSKQTLVCEVPFDSEFLNIINSRFKWTTVQDIIIKDIKEDLGYQSLKEALAATGIDMHFIIAQVSSNGILNSMIIKFLFDYDNRLMEYLKPSNNK